MPKRSCKVLPLSEKVNVWYYLWSQELLGGLGTYAPRIRGERLLYSFQNHQILVNGPTSFYKGTEQLRSQLLWAEQGPKSPRGHSSVFLYCTASPQHGSNTSLCLGPINIKWEESGEERWRNMKEERVTGLLSQREHGRELGHLDSMWPNRGSNSVLGVFLSTSVISKGVRTAEHCVCKMINTKEMT